APPPRASCCTPSACGLRIPSTAGRSKWRRARACRGPNLSPPAPDRAMCSNMNSLERPELYYYNKLFFDLVLDGMHEEVALVEVWREPDAAQRAYASSAILRRGETIEMVALPGAVVRTQDLLPPRA